MHVFLSKLLILSPAFTTHAAALRPVRFQDPAPQNAQPPTPLLPQAKLELAAELKEMMRLDQLHRTPVSWGTVDREELARLEALDDEAHMEETKRRWRENIRLPKELEKELMAKQAKLDSANVARLAELIEQYGYPAPQRLGMDAPDPIPVLIHASLGDYAKLKAVLKVEVMAGRMPAKPYAALTDRKLQHAGKVQIYGTSSAFDPKTNTVLPPEIVSIEATNRARGEIGLPPLAEYRLAKPTEDANEPSTAGAAPGAAPAVGSGP